MSEKILVVDDEKDIVKVLAKILELSGYETHSAFSGMEALKAVKDFRPELVLLDYMMPDLTGLDVLRGIKSFSEDIYVVMVTGRGSEEVAAKVMKAGASDYIIKPFDKNQIVTVVKDTLRIRTAELKAKSLQQELRKLNLELEDKVRERTKDLIETQERLIQQHNMATLGEMSGGMAHEIRNPLNSISLYSQLIQDELEPDDRKLDFVGKIMKDVERIDAIVENLNRISRRVKREKKPVELTGPLDTTLRTLSTQLTNKKVEVGLETEEGLPPVLASPEEMEEVFTHLTLNSIHAMPEGGRITVSMKRVMARIKNGLMEEDTPEKEFVEISFADTGLGISDENLPKIFIPFFTTKTDWQGTGLGLSLVHQAVQDMGGIIEVSSEEGKGTTFTIRIPALEKNAVADKGA